ncbi:MAG: glycerophosphodiester phosphodiesterase [Candidatus Lokiarchaeota archaeon]|nr:glycerophosphodiester phosphodiesterase [Candidatus Lokiarchaeota archaeon]
MLKFFIGHRGTRIDYDENTLDAFEIALKSGANYIEFDVRKTIDNKLVIFHDSKVDRITNTLGYIEDFRYPEIARMHFKLTDSRVPTLDEVLKKFEKRIKFIVELKSENIREYVIKTIINYNLLGDCIISGRNLNDLEIIKQSYLGSYVCYNITKGKGLNLKDFMIQGEDKSLHFKPDLISLHSKMITQEFIEICHKNEILVLSWDFIGYKDPFKVIKGLIEMGIDGILFDNYKNITYAKHWLAKINQIS